MLVYTKPVDFFFARSDWLLKLGISCTIHWFAKHNGRAREQSPFQPSFDQIRFIFYRWLFTGIY